MPRTLSVEEFKELGKRYYGRKDYERSLDAFTDGIDASVGRDIQLYDYRAATYDKLNNMTAALADARHMIKAYEKDPRGYLRAGQLLLKMDKQQQALQIYARGMKYVPSNNPQANLLRGAHDKLNRELCPPKAVDPFAQLPQEIVEMIMSYLKFYELVSCLRVSKQWKMFLESLPNLWTKMDLLRAGGRRSVKPSFVKTCMRMAKGKITCARIANFGHSGVLQHLVTTCRALEKLEFVLMPLGVQSILEATIPARALKSLTVHADTEIHGDAILQILKHRPTLEELRIHHVGEGCTASRTYDFDLPNLQILDLRAVHPKFTQVNHFHSLVIRTPNVRDLIFEEAGSQTVPTMTNMPYFHHLARLEHLRIKTHHLVGFPAAALTLRSLDFESTLPTPSVAHGFPNLERLRIKTISGDALPKVLDMWHGNEGMQLPEKPSMLMVVEFASGTIPEWDVVTQVIEHSRLREVEELALEGLTATEIGDETVPKIVELKHLQSLRLDSARITGVGIKQLVTGLKSTLKHITLTACDGVGHDAVDWAARQGVEVVVHENGGKAVRRR